MLSFKKKTIVSTFGFVAMMGFAIPGIFVFNIPGTISVNFSLLYCVVIWSTLRLTYAGMIGKRRLSMLFFYVFVYVFMGVQPLISAWSGIYPHKELSLKPEHYTNSIILVILGILAFEIGYLKLRSASKTVTEPVATPIPANAPSAFSMFNLWIAISFVSSLVALSSLYYGLNIYLSLRDGASFNDAQGPQMSGTEAQLVINGIRALAAVVLFIALYKRKVGRLYHQQRSVQLTMALLLLIFINMIVSNPLNAPRLWSGSVVLTCMLISLKWTGARSFLRWALGASLALLLLFSGTDPRRIFSQTLSRGDEINFVTTMQSIVEGVSSLPYDSNFDAFQMITYTTVYTERFGYSWGYQTLLPIFFWIPRTVWPAKPIGTSDIVGVHAGFFNVNVSSPLWAEGYINFGLIGLMLFLFLVGRGASMSDRTLMQTAVLRPAFQTIVSAYFASNMFILLRGDLTSGTMYLQMIIVFLLIILVVVRKTKAGVVAGSNKVINNPLAANILS